MTDLLYAGIVHGKLDDALDRFRHFAMAHPDFEPSLQCERDGQGRRRWVITVVRRIPPYGAVLTNGQEDDA